MDFRNRKNCILCLETELGEVFQLHPTPIANRLPKTLSKAEEEAKVRIPLTLISCKNCEHVQLKEVVSPNVLFSDYPYVSVTNTTMKIRLETLSDSIIRESGIDTGESILEIGSNDGALLREFQKMGIRVLGVDPAKEIAEKANKSGIPTIVDFFSPALLKKITKEIGIPKVIIANNVLAHTNELRDIIYALSILMGKETHLFLEFSYLLSVLEDTLIDTIYHEHTSYHHLKPLLRTFEQFGLKIVSATRFGAHGGSLRVHVVSDESKIGVQDKVKELMEIEDSLKLGNLEGHTWDRFRDKASSLSSRLKFILEGEMRERRPQPIGYGISAKFSSLYYGLGLDQFELASLYDDNPLKVGRFAPGSLKQIKSPSGLEPKPNQAIFLFSWNYKDDVIARLRKGNPNSRVIVPLPRTEIIV